MRCHTISGPNFSGGCTLSGFWSKKNKGHGVEVTEDVSAIVILRDGWIEANGKDGVRLISVSLHLTGLNVAGQFRVDNQQTVRSEWAAIRRSDLILIDELGYVPLERMAAEQLFGFFSQCSETTSLIVTTNVPFADWPQIFAGDERLAGALLARLTHHVQVIEIEGESYRLQASFGRQPKKEGEGKGN